MIICYEKNHIIKIWFFFYFKRANFVGFHSYIYERKKPHENVSEVKMLKCIDIFNIIIKIISEAVYL